MQASEAIKRALVLGGGGVAGVAWELGILKGLEDQGVELLGADIIIGTSAGSMVGAQITSGTDLASLFASQLTPVEQPQEHRATLDLSQTVKAWSQAVQEGGSDRKAIRARIGAYALTVPTVSATERRAEIAARLPVHTWPEHRLLIVAVDAETGEEYIMDRESGVSLVDAVAASCAVPGIRPLVTIAGRRYMDGGVRSATNADVARGHDRVLILNPLGANANVFGAGPATEAADLEREGSQVLLIEPDTTSVTAIGLNPMDPATREPAALAGRALGNELAASVTAFWSQG